MANNKNITFNQLEASMTKVKAAIDKKANTSHGNHVPKTETANNARFLRNDNTWQTITPVNIGAADRSHNHTSLTGVTNLQFAAASSDHATIKVTTDGGSAANTYLDFEMDDDTGSDMFRWRFNAWDSSASASTGQFNLMTLSAKDTTSARLTVNGDVTASSFTGNASSATKLQTARAIKIGNTSRNFDGNANVTWTLADIGAAPSSHGTHVTWSTTTPKANGTAAVGTETKVARGDHVHPLQTNVSGSSGSCTGNAATATKLKTARNIALTGTITGNANFDGSGNISIATSVNNVPASGNWFKGIPTVTSAGVMEVGKYIDFHNAADGTTDYDVRLQCNGTSANTVNMPTNSGTLALLSDNVTSATRLQTARKLTIGNTGKTFDGSSNVSWSLNEIGAAPNTHSHNFLNIKGSNTISSTANDTTANWTEQNNSIHWYSTSEQLIDQPSQYGFLINLANGGDVHQIWTIQSSGNMYHRGGNGSGWSGTWRTILDSSNFTSYSPTLSGGGAIGTWGINITGNASTATTLQTARTLTIGKTEKNFNGANNVSWSLSEIGAQPANSLTIKTVSNRILTLGTELYQYAEITSNNTIINLPSVSSFTEIHLFFDWPSGVSIVMPSNVKWQEGVMYGPGYTHEFIFTYVNSDIGWLGGCIVYG